MDLGDLRSNWDALGRENPLWAILTTTGEWDIDEFFETGRTEISGMLDRLHDLGLEPTGDALDFGCGAGRLTQALADHFETATGVDVARSMIELATEHNRHGDRCRFVLNESEDLSCFDDGSFDFVYSNIVLQHVGTERAKGYIAEFLRITAPGGILAFQVPSHLLPVQALDPAECRARIEVLDPITSPGSVPTVPAGTPIPMKVKVRNTGTVAWGEDIRARLGVRWLRWDDYRLVPVDEGQRVRLPGHVEPGDEVVIDCVLDVPVDVARFTAVVDVVQENVAWFADVGSRAAHVSLATGRGVRRRLGPAGADGGDDVPLIARMEMHPVDREDVLAIVEANGGEMVAVLDDRSAGPEWVSHLYVVRRRGEPGSQRPTEVQVSAVP